MVQHAADGEQGLCRLASHDFDMIVLDLMLPSIPGGDVCKRIRARGDHTPVLMLTALDETDERVAGLRMGADDYLPKPFDFEELIARIEALHRRNRHYADANSGERLVFKGLVFDRAALQLSVDGCEVELSVKERDLIAFFLSNQKKVLSRERILNAIWNSQEDPMTNVVDVYIGRLRGKLGPYADVIVTVRGAG